LYTLLPLVDCTVTKYTPAGSSAVSNINIGSFSIPSNNTFIVAHCKEERVIFIGLPTGELFNCIITIPSVGLKCMEVEYFSTLFFFRPHHIKTSHLCHPQTFVCWLMRKKYICQSYLRKAVARQQGKILNR